MEVVIDHVAGAAQHPHEIEWWLLAETALEHDANAVLRLGCALPDLRQQRRQQLVVLLTGDHPAEGDQCVCVLGGDQPGGLPLDVVQLAQEHAVLVEDGDRVAEIVIGDLAPGDLLGDPSHAVVFVPQVVEASRRVRVLGEVQDLARVVGVAAPDRRQISSRIADGVGDEQVELDPVAQRKLERGLEDRTQVGAEVRIGQVRLQRGAPHLEGEHAGGVDDLLREVHLEVAGHLASGVAPAAHRVEVRGFDLLPALEQRIVERLVAPFLEDAGGRQCHVIPPLSRCPVEEQVQNVIEPGLGASEDPIGVRSDHDLHQGNERPGEDPGVSRCQLTVLDTVLDDRLDLLGQSPLIGANETVSLVTAERVDVTPDQAGQFTLLVGKLEEVALVSWARRSRQLPDAATADSNRRRLLSRWPSIIEM